MNLNNQSLMKYSLRCLTGVLTTGLAVSLAFGLTAPMQAEAARKKKTTAKKTTTVTAVAAPSAVTVPIANVSVTIPADAAADPATITAITQVITAVQNQAKENSKAGKTAKQNPITIGVTGNALFVLPGMTGCFASIQSAVDAAQPGDTIVVFPGTYTESVDAHSKNLNIIGMDRETCIIQYSAMDYDHPPIQMAVGSLSNLTVLGLADLTNWPPARPAYCLHVDYDEMIGMPLFVQNVGFVNQAYCAIGVGLRKNSMVSFVDCSFAASDSSAVFMHDWEMLIPEVNGDNQVISFGNCTFTNSSVLHPTIWFNSQEVRESCAYVNFVDCKVSNAMGADSAHLINMASYQGRIGNQIHYLGSTDWMLMPTSKGNNVPAMNYVEGINMLPAPVAVLPSTPVTTDTVISQ